MITNCTRCQCLFYTSSEEYANEPDRLCPTCLKADNLKKEHEQAQRAHQQQRTMP